MHLTPLVLLPIGFAAYAVAECCNPVADAPDQYFEFGMPPAQLCADGSYSTPCCGEGGCNIFCCNCDGGCRTDTWMEKIKRDDLEDDQSIPVDSLFQSVDGDTDQYLSLAEYIVWVERTKGESVVKNATMLEMWIEKFESHDANGDGKIEPGEMELSSRESGKGRKG
ncbi:hypothetical protein BDR22DRAFT_964767 [Usnea florida]